MISSIEISRFRGIREGKLEDLTPLVVLVGPNGCGKSSVLDALLIAASARTREGVGRAVGRHQGVRYGVPWLLWRKGVHGPCEIKIQTGEDYKRSCTLMPGPRFNEGLQIACEVDDGDPHHSGKLTITFKSGNELDLSRDMVAPAPPPFLWRVRIIEPHENDREMPLDILLTEALEQGLTGQVMAIIGQVVAGAKELRMGTEGGIPLIYLIYEDHGVPLALAGDGVYSLVRLSLELATYPCGTVLLEEPEVHQHPRAIRQTMRAVLAAVRRDIQVILTTHSLELIDALLAESSDEDLEKLSLYRLELENGRLISVRMPGPDVAFSRQRIEDDLR